MASHKSDLGTIDDNIQGEDLDGYVPDETTGPYSLNYDHGTEETHNDDGSLTKYGLWWETVCFPAYKAAAIKSTQNAAARAA